MLPDELKLCALELFHAPPVLVDAPLVYQTSEMKSSV